MVCRADKARRVPRHPQARRQRRGFHLRGLPLQDPRADLDQRIGPPGVQPQDRQAAVLRRLRPRDHRNDEAAAAGGAVPEADAAAARRAVPVRAAHRRKPLRALSQPGFWKIAGLPASEKMETPGAFERRIHPEDRAEYYRTLSQSADALEPWIHEFRITTADGVEKWLRVSGVRSANADGVTWHGYLDDVSVRKKQEMEIEELAYFDPLTGLPNRRLLLSRMAQAIAGCSDSGDHAALLFIDLDNFKTLNDTQGHDIGDAFLVQVAERLRRCLAPRRHGGAHRRRRIRRHPARGRRRPPARDATRHPCSQPGAGGAEDRFRARHAAPCRFGKRRHGGLRRAGKAARRAAEARRYRDVPGQGRRPQRRRPVRSLDDGPRDRALPADERPEGGARRRAARCCTSSRWSSHEGVMSAPRR